MTCLFSVSYNIHTKVSFRYFRISGGYYVNKYIWFYQSWCGKVWTQAGSQYGVMWEM